MPKYAFLGGYTSASWKGMIEKSETRRDAVQKAADAVGATVEAFYLTFGDDDFLLIVDAPDDEAAAAISLAVVSTGALRGIRTIKLIDSERTADILGKARSVINAYVPPGTRQPAGVG